MSQPRRGPVSTLPIPPRPPKLERPRKRSWLRRRRGLILLLLGGVVLLAAVDAAWSFTRIKRDLSDVRYQLGQGIADLKDGRLRDASARFSLARTTAEDARSVTWHPTPWLGSLLPWVGDDVKAVRALSKA